MGHASLLVIFQLAAELATQQAGIQIIFLLAGRILSSISGKTFAENAKTTHLGESAAGRESFDHPRRLLLEEGEGNLLQRREAASGSVRSGVDQAVADCLFADGVAFELITRTDN